MAERLFIGIDVGSSSTKALLVSERGAIVASTRRPHAINRPHPGWAEMDAERDWWGAAAECLRELLGETGGDTGSIAGVGVCSIGASFVPVDAAGEVLRSGILYGIDSRASREIQELNELFGEQELLQRTGRRLSSQSVGPKIAWLKAHEPGVWSRTARLLTPAALITSRLCGSAAIDLHTALSFDPLFNVRTGGWDPAMCEHVMGDRAVLPAISWPGDRLGVVSEEGTQRTGIPTGVPVACGTADVVAEALGAGVQAEGDLMVMYGSTLFLLQRVADFTPHPLLWPSLFLKPSQPTLLAGTSSAGSLLHWFSREFAGGGDLDALLAEAERIPPGSDGLLCLPYFAGERAPIFDPIARGLFLGLSMEHTRAHLLRALLEGIAFSFRHLLETFADAGQPPRRLFGSGGGIRTRLWTQIMSDVSGLEQRLARLPEGAALGAAFLGAQAAGAFTREEPIPHSWAGATRPLMPRPGVHEQYTRLYSLFRTAYETNAGLMHELVRSRDSVNARDRS